MMSPTPFPRGTRDHLILLAVAAVTVTSITACTGNGRTGQATMADDAHHATGRATPSADRPPLSFLTVATSAYKFTSVQPLYDMVSRYPVETLQLRSIRHGRLIRTLLRSVGELGSLEATSAADGTVIAAADFGCRSQLFRIDPATGKTTLIEAIGESAGNIALSPDGTRLAYLTDLPSQRQPCQPMRQPHHPVKMSINPGGILSLPPADQVLVIRNLVSGATVRKVVAHGADPTWSPDGAEIAETDTWANVTHVLSAATLDGLRVHKFLPPRGCGYTATAWTRSGLAIAVGCNIEHGPNAPALELMPLTGPGRAARLALPGCTAWVDVSFAGGKALIGADLGYGGGNPCGQPRPGGYAVVALLRRGARLDMAATFPQQGGQFTVAGW